jgi:peflin
VEYCTLHKFIQVVRNAFINADADRSGRIEAREIFQALQQCGFNYLTFTTIVELMGRFDTTKRGLDWGEFLLLMAMIAHCRSLFEWNDRDRDGWITINQDQMIQLTAFLS